MNTNKMLSMEQMEQIHTTALKILADVGIKFHHREVLEIFKKTGLDVNIEAEVVKIPEYLIKEALKTAPAQFSMYNREMTEETIWGDSEVKLGAGGSVINILDSDGRTIREPTTEDLLNMYQLTDNLPEISWTAPGSFVTDVPHEISAVWRFYLRLKYGSKPSCADGLNVVDLIDNCEMLEVIRDNEENFINKPLAIVQPCPMSPLSWNFESASYLIESARRKMPALMISMPFAGVSSPVTMAGAIAQQTAELLSGLVLMQIIHPGLPTVYAGASAHADMRDVSNVMGSIEAQMMNAATIQMAHYYQIPSGTGAVFGYSDSKRNDYQGGADSVIGQLLLTLSGANVVYGIGELAGMDANSLEKVVMDHEIFRSIKKFLNGIPVSKETLAFDIVKEVGPEGDFLGNKHTHEWFKKEYIFADILDRKSKSAWEKEGAKDSQERAKEYVQSVLKKSALNRLSPEKDKELNKTMNHILKRRGFKLDHYLSLLPD
jgi:trimethylamine---corrinoid protein Co-methyltransferase